MKRYVIALFSTLALASCQQQSQKSQEPQALASQTQDTSDQIHRMAVYDYSSSVEVGSHTYNYAIHGEAVDSLGIVTDEMGERYADNCYRLTVTRDGGAFFDHRFTKGTFRSLLDKGFARNGILDGFRFFKVQDAKLLFCVCVSYPESDMSAPFILAVGPDGSYTIDCDNNLDVDNSDDNDGV